jgi:hypothetical protein
MPKIGVFRAYIALFGTEKVDLRKSFHHEGHEEHEEKRGWLAFGKEDVLWWRSSLHFWRS